MPGDGEAPESRRSSESTEGSGRMSVVNLGSAVEMLLEHARDRDKPAQLPIKLSARLERTQSTDDTFDQLAAREIQNSSSTAHSFSPRERSPFVSNTAFMSLQDSFNVPAFPPVSVPISPAGQGSGLSSRRGSSQLASAPDLSTITVVSQARAGSGSSSRKGSDQSADTAGSSVVLPGRGPELFLDVARLTSMQVEKDRALSRAQAARSKGLATESVGTRNARIAIDPRASVERGNTNLANAESYHKHGRIDSNIALAMASFGISYDTSPRPSSDNRVGPLEIGQDKEEQTRAERKRRKRMRRQLEHERVVKETPIEEYS